jgi:hypothetical protein
MGFQKWMFGDSSQPKGSKLSKTKAEEETLVASIEDEVAHGSPDGNGRFGFDTTSQIEKSLNKRWTQIDSKVGHWKKHHPAKCIEVDT